MLQYISIIHFLVGLLNSYNKQKFNFATLKSLLLKITWKYMGIPNAKLRCVQDIYIICWTHKKDFLGDAEFFWRHFWRSALFYKDFKERSIYRKILKHRKYIYRMQFPKGKIVLSFSKCMLDFFLNPWMFSYKIFSIISLINDCWITLNDILNIILMSIVH